VKQANPKRKAKTLQRAYGGAERKEWIKKLPCTIAHCFETPSVNSHVGDVTSDKGAGYKSSARYVIPMCVGHEREYHHGSESFAKRYGVDLMAEAHRIEQCWQQHLEDELAKG
jgi:hypothetical protein